MGVRRISLAVVSEPGKAGVKTHVIDLLRNIDLDRFKLSYHYSLRRCDDAYPGEIASLRSRGIECLEVPMDVSMEPFSNLRSLFRLIVSLRRERPAILHLHSSKAGGLGRLASLFLRPRPKVIYTPHAMACYRSRGYLWLERILGFLTDTLVAVSASERDDFIRWRIPKAEQTETIPLGLPAMAKSTAGLRASESGRCWIVGACGRICFQKNALFFFQVALEVLRDEKDYRFKWIGDFGHDREADAVRSLLQLADNPPQIEITDWVANPPAQIETLDVFCMFSRYESFGYVTAEAMLLGVPVLATPATGTIDLVRHEVTGLLVEPKVEAVVASLRRLRADSTLRAQLASNASRFVSEHHTVAKMVTACERLYLQHHS